MQMESLIIRFRMILRNPPEKPQALKSAVTNAKWALWHSVGVPPTLSDHHWEFCMFVGEDNHPFPKGTLDQATSPDQWRYRRYGTLTLECLDGGTHDWQSSYHNSPRS